MIDFCVMRNEIGEYEEEIKQESREKFFELFKSYGATEEDIENLKVKLPEMPENFHVNGIEHKLALLDSMGVPIEKICEHPRFLQSKMKCFLLKCEVALLEDIFGDLSYFSTTQYKELV